MADSADLEALYRDFHQHPELGFQEHRTAGIVAERMRELGLAVTEGIGGTGVAAVLENGDGPVVWLRADMDGLPVEELTGLDYASRASITAADGSVTKLMHACGHDMHVTWLVGAMDDLAATKTEWSGTVVALFQPAEETIVGAKAMLDDGLLTKVPRPDIVVGQHVAPFPAGVISLTSGAAMAGVDDISIVLHGQGGHGSRPETTTDPVLAAAATVMRLQSIVSREVTPGKLAVLTVGMIQSGSKSNVIPAEAFLEVSVRTVDPGIRERVVGSITRVVNAEAEASGMTVPPTITINASAPATVNSHEHVEKLRARFTEEWGPAIIDYGTVSGSEDVGQLATAAEAPLVFWIIGGMDPATVLAAQAAGRFEQDIPSNHSPYFAPVLHPTIERGVEALVLGARTFLAG